MARTLRIIVISAGCLVLLLGLSVVLGFTWLRGEAGRTWTLAQVEQVVRDETGLDLTVERLEGNLLSTILLHRVALADRDGRWLTMERARIEWLPWDLIGRHLHITSLTALGLEVTRAPILQQEPESATQSPSTAGGSASLPIDISLDRLSIQPIALGEALLGETATLKLDGKLTAREGERLAVDLTVVRHDEPGGTLDASATYQLSERRFDARVTLAEPSGALMRRLTGLSQAGATLAKLESGGDLSDIKGTAELQIDGLGQVDSNFSLALEKETRVTASGQLRSDWIPPDVPPALWDGEISFAVDAALSERGQLTAKRLAIENRIAAIEAAGSFDGDRNAVSATADIALKDQAAIGALIAPLQISEPLLSLAVEGTLDQPELEIVAGVSALAAPGLQSDAVGLTIGLSPVSGTALEDLRLAFSASGGIAGLAVEGQSELATLLGPEVTWQADGSVDLEQQAVTLSQARIVGDQVTISALGDADFTPGLDLDATLDLADLGQLQSLIGFAPAGQLQLDAKLDSPDLTKGLEAVLSGRLSEFALDDTTLDPLLGSAPSFAAEVTLEGYEQVGLSGLNAVIQAGTLSGDLDIDLPKAELAGNLAFAAPDLAVLTPLVGEALSGAGNLTAAVSGALSDPAAKGKLRLSKFALGPLVPSQLDIDFNARKLVSAPQGRVDLDLDARQLSLVAGTDFELNDQTLRLAGLSLQGDGVAAEGELRMPLSGPPVQGQLTLTVSDLAPSLSLLALDGSGSGTAELALDQASGRQTLDLTGQFQSIRLGPPEASDLSVQTARISAQSPDLFAGGLADLRINLQNLSAGGVALDSLGLTGSGAPENARFELAARGDLQGPLALDAAGTVSLAAGRTAVTLDQLDGQLLGEDVALSDPARLTFAEQSLHADNLQITFGTARLSLDAEVSETSTDARLEATNVPLALAKIAAPDFEIKGTADLKAKLSGPSSRPTGSFSFEARDVNLGEDLDSPPLQVEAEGTLGGGRLALTSRLSGFARETALLELAVPFQLAVLPFAAEIGQDQALSGSLKWAGELSELWALVPVDGHRVTGPADIDLSLSGTPRRPRADGQMTITKGEYENFETGTLLRDLVLVLDLSGDRLIVRTLTANDGGNGSLKGSGQLDLKPELDFPFSFETSLIGLTLARRDDVTAGSDGTLKMDGTITETAIEGSFKTTTIEIRIPNTLPPEVVDLEVTERGASRAGSPEVDKDQKQRGGTKVTLDVSVDMPARVFVRGRGLDTEWKGFLRITGTAAKPIVEGELENLRGRLRVVGKDFSLQQSRISFAGTSDLAPLLDIRAVNDQSDLQVTVTVTGAPDNPTITLSSVPTLPREEILARVLFGKNTTQLSAFEAIQLATSVAELSGSGLGGKGTLDFTRDLIGVDVLNVGTADDDSGDAEVSAGKYITDDVFVGVKQGTAPGSSAVEVEVELTPNISVGSDVGSSGESNIGVKFKWDY